MCRSGFRLIGAGVILFAVGTGRSQVTRPIQAVGYRVGGGSSPIDLHATGLIPGASGDAWIEAKKSVTTVDVHVSDLRSPTKLGAEFLTYVLWAVSPEGRSVNLGGIVIDKNERAKIKTTTPLQAFSLFVTAEPYSAVRQPSEMVVLENVIRKDTKGKIFPVQEYKLLQRTQYEKRGNPLSLTPDLAAAPLEMYEARNAVDIAGSRAAEQYASGIYSKATGALKMAETALARKANRKEVVSTAKLAAQFAEDARALSVERQEQERIARERAEVAARARAEAEARAAREVGEVKRRADEEARRQAELAAARQAQFRAEALAREARLQAEAEVSATRARAEADRLRAREEAARTDADRAHRAANNLRAQLLEQFNRILETRDTARGLVATMADVLFDTGKFELRMDAREKLARFSGIVLAHPGLHLEVEGHTDSIGGDEYNLKLSQQRAAAVQHYLVRQGLPDESISAMGLGKDQPVAGNGTAAGRQKNRRVELIVSGEVIGVQIGK